MVFAATASSGRFTETIWNYDSGPCGHSCVSDKGMFATGEIRESIWVGNGKIMMTSKVGSLHCYILQVDGSDLYITLQECSLSFGQFMQHYSSFEERSQHEYRKSA